MVREILGEGDSCMDVMEEGQVTLNAVCWGGGVRGRLDSLHAEMVSTHACILGSMRYTESQRGHL